MYGMYWRVGAVGVLLLKVFRMVKGPLSIPYKRGKNSLLKYSF